MRNEGGIEVEGREEEKKVGRKGERKSGWKEDEDGKAN